MCTVKFLDPGQYDKFLVTMIDENMQHMRHVEEERAEFLSLYLLAFSIVISAVLITDNFPTSIILLLFLFVVGLISYVLVKRWDHVFNNHKVIVKGLLSELKISQTDDDVNRYFLFDNRKMDGVKKNYIRTSRFFMMFIYCTQTVVLLLIIIEFLIKYGIIS